MEKVSLLFENRFPHYEKLQGFQKENRKELFESVEFDRVLPEEFFLDQLLFLAVGK